MIVVILRGGAKMPIGTRNSFRLAIGNRDQCGDRSVFIKMNIGRLIPFRGKNHVKGMPGSSIQSDIEVGIVLDPDNVRGPSRGGCYIVFYGIFLNYKTKICAFLRCRKKYQYLNSGIN